VRPMGVLDSLRTFFGGKPAEPPTPPEALALTKRYIEEGKLPMPSLKELGISGTANWFGSPMVEENSRLQREAGYGQPGTEAWGEWERMIHTNPYVAMALEFVTAQLRDAKVEVVPVSAEYMADRGLAESQAKFCREMLFERSRPGWPALMEQFVRGAVGYGFSLHEKCFERIAHPLLPGGSGFGLAKLAERLPSSVHPQGWLQNAATGELETIRQWGMLPNGTWGGDALATPASKVLLFSRNRAGNNYLGFSQFRPVYFLVRSMAEIVKTISISVIREGAGIPVAYTEDKESSLSKGQQQKLRKLLSNTVVHEYASLVLPPGWKADWITSKGANKGHIVEVYQSMGLIILMQVFGQQLVLGTGSTGSRSVGEVHDLRADSFVTGVKAGIEGVINGDGREPGTGLLRDLVAFNWGEQPAYPKLVITLKKPRVDVGVKATALATAITAGVMTPTIDVENSLREDLGVDPISEEDRDLHLEQKRQQAMEIAGAQAQQQDGEDPKKPFPPKKFSAAAWAKAKQKRLAAGTFTPRRPLRDSEKHLDLAAMDSFLKRARDDFERGAKPLVGELLLRVQPNIRAAMKDGRIEHGEIAALPLDLTRLAAFCGDFIAKARAEGRRQLAAEKRRGKTPKPGELVTQPTHLAEEQGDDRDPPTTPDEADARHERNDSLLDAAKKRVARKVEARLRAQLEATAIDVERTGGEADDVIRDVMDEQYDTAAFRSDAGSVLMTAFNLGRDDFMAEYGDEVDGVELSCALDENSCDTCERMDGEEFDFGSAGYEENCPPLRECDGKNACRCLYTVIWK
jgi:hypothetical protein